MAQEPTSDHLFVDEFYFSALLDQLEGTDQNFVASDANYAEEQQFQEALMASVEAASNGGTVNQTVPSTKEQGSSSGSSSAADAAADTVVEEGQTSENVCEICSEKRGVDEFYFPALLDQLEGTDQDFVASDAKYAEMQQFQEVFMASVEAASNGGTVKETVPSTKELGSSSGSSSAADAAADTVVEEGQTSENVCEICSEKRGVDEFYFSALLDQLEGTDQDFVASDAKYAEMQQFQEVFMASVEAASNGGTVKETVPSTKELGSSSGSSSAADAAADMVVEEGQTSQNFCEICAENREVDEMFRNGKCCHTFCSYCISKHVAVKIQENVRTVTCPALSCEVVLEADDCRGIVAREVMERWEEVRSESLIPASQKFYCPFKDCSAMLVDDNGGEVIRESECPECRRLFCANCHVPWHSGFGCEEYQTMNEDEKGREDLMLRELAADKKWRRCPQCKFYVEINEGCLHMTCRCKYQFCYGCGAQWTQEHGGCQTQ